MHDYLVCFESKVYVDLYSASS